MEEQHAKTITKARVKLLTLCLRTGICLRPIYQQTPIFHYVSLSRSTTVYLWIMQNHSQPITRIAKNSAGAAPGGYSYNEYVINLPAGTISASVTT